jgi:hypothetical protein
MNLCIPKNILKQHVAVLGKTGAGKSSALRHVVEHLLTEQKRVCIIDPKGDWWGLKVSADGKGPGFPVIAFGDFKEPKASDVPINQQSGKHIAELIASGNRPCVIGFRGWMTGHMVRFWIDFASTLFNANSGELYLVGDEFHNFAPKGKIQDPESGKCLHWSNRLMSEGRGYGLVCLIASQRPQKVHNDTLTCCETLVAMRVIHKADRDAVQDWIEGCGDMAKGKEVLNSLAGMARGEAFVWSPEIGFGPERLTFPMFRTFDSFAPPQLQKKVSQTGWADVNLEEVKAKLASVIEEAKANDPAELKREIAALKKALAASSKSAPVEVKSVEVPIFNKDDYKTIKSAAELFDRMESALAFSVKEAREVYKELNSLSAKVLCHAPASAQRKPAGLERLPTRQTAARVFERPARGETLNGSLGRCERAILTALAQYPQGRAANQIAVLTGYSVGSGGFNNSLSRLRSSDYVTRGQPIQITDSGLQSLGDYTPLPTGRDLVNHWLGQLAKCEAAILSALIEVYPEGLTSEQVAEKTNYQASSGGFNNSLSRLRTLELITRGQPMRASEEFFQ